MAAELDPDKSSQATTTKKRSRPSSITTELTARLQGLGIALEMKPQESFRVTSSGTSCALTELRRLCGSPLSEYDPSSAALEGAETMGLSLMSATALLQHLRIYQDSSSAGVYTVGFRDF